MQSLNEQVFSFIFGLAHRYSWLDQFGIFLAEYLPYILFLSALVLIFSESGLKRKILFFSHLVLVLILGRGILVEAINVFYPTLRPPGALGVTALVGEGGSSFPSSHATILFGVAMTIFYINKKWGTWFLIFAFLNGLSRVFAGVHFPIDIVVGAFLGVAIGILVYQAVESYFRLVAVPKTGA